MAPGRSDKSWVCLQDVLRSQARSPSSAHLLLYALGELSSPPTAVSYSTLYETASQCSIRLANLAGFTEDRPVLLYLDDHWDIILWFWAVILARGIPVLSPSFSNINREKHLHALSELLESPVCITRVAFLQSFEDVSHSLKVHTVESLVGGTSPRQASKATCFESMPLGEDMRSVKNAPDDSSLAVLMLTSGSTGNAKAVRLTHGQILAAIAGKASVRPLPESGAFLNWIRLDHVASLIEIHIQALWLGVNQVHVHAADIMATPLQFLELLSRHRVSRSFAPNFFLARLSQEFADDPTTLHEWDLSNLAVLASGGEANDVQTCIAASKILMRYGAPENVITPGFGMTETCAGAIFNTNLSTYDVATGRDVASLGRCMPGIEMRVMDSITGTFAAPGVTGDLDVRGPVVFDGYYRDPAATTLAFTSDGWFRTADQASVDSEGNLSLVGRRDDVVNINGVKIAISALQSSLDPVFRTLCADRVIVFPSRIPGASSEQVTVVYIPRWQPPKTQDLAEADKLATETCMMVNLACRPFVFSVGESLPLIPRSTLGKISAAKMRAMFEAGVFERDIAHHRRLVSEYRQHMQQISSQFDIGPAEGLLRLDFAESIGKDVESIDVDAPLFELGFTSMDLIRLKVRIDTRLGITVDTVLLLKNPTVRSLSGALQQLMEKNYIAAPGISTPQEGTSHHDFANVTIDTDYDPVVTLLPKGGKSPLWLVHPGIGEVLVFVGLSQHMRADDRPVYALRARGLEPGQRNFASVAEAVDTYVAAVRRRQPRGPYALAGYSYGAMLAFEMTKVLEKEGAAGQETVRFLGTFNLPPHIKTRMRQLEWNMCLLHLVQFLGLVTEDHADQEAANERSPYRLASREEALQIVLDLAGESRMRELGLGPKDLERWANVAYALPNMAVEYEPSGCVKSLDVFHAEPLKIVGVSREEWVNEHLSKWRDFCRTEPRFHRVGGGHYTMLGPDHVADFAKQLRATLKARGA
ncbi:acetyl-CoA synthetase-like protein [Annulohypoxylon bovei var. microspora]|nr:acetyl-CoA synthetase-like protein [Annulohypoxylon bovei var. microspora]